MVKRYINYIERLILIFKPFILDFDNLISPFFLNHKEIKKIIELIFFSYRDFTEGPDRLLEKLKFGRAHHRVIYFVGKKNNITIKELLLVLKITKQSLNRVLRDLKKIEVINYKKDLKDYRVKHVILTEKGKDLTNKIFIEQKKRIYKALQNSNSQAVLNFDSIIKKIING